MGSTVVTPLERKAVNLKSDRESLARWISFRFRSARELLEQDCRNFYECLQETLEEDCWRVLADDWKEFCSNWIKMDSETVNHLIEGMQRIGITEAVPVERAVSVGRMTAAERAESAPERPKQGERTDLERRDNITKLERGTSANYLAARIKRDRPDIHERILNNEFPSIYAAGREAGIVPKQVTITSRMQASRIANHLHQLLDDEKLRELKGLL